MKIKYKLDKRGRLVKKTSFNWEAFVAIITTLGFLAGVLAMWLNAKQFQENLSRADSSLLLTRQSLVQTQKQFDESKEESKSAQDTLNRQFKQTMESNRALVDRLSGMLTEYRSINRPYLSCAIQVNERDSNEYRVVIAVVNKGNRAAEDIEMDAYGFVMANQTVSDYHQDVTALAGGEQFSFQPWWLGNFNLGESESVLYLLVLCYTDPLTKIRQHQTEYFQWAYQDGVYPARCEKSTSMKAVTDYFLKRTYPDVSKTECYSR